MAPQINQGWVNLETAVVFEAGKHPRCGNCGWPFSQSIGQIVESIHATFACYECKAKLRWIVQLCAEDGLSPKVVRRLVEAECVWCKEIFVRKKAVQRYCSRRCANFRKQVA